VAIIRRSGFHTPSRAIRVAPWTRVLRGFAPSRGPNPPTVPTPTSPATETATIQPHATTPRPRDTFTRRDPSHESCEGAGRRGHSRLRAPRVTMRRSTTTARIMARSAANAPKDAGRRLPRSNSE
jgi:hypothetical protein